jgi:Lon protease-like protein
MIMPAPTGGTTDYGTMLEIRSVQMLPDGRSMVETFGAHRFRIVERGTIDGYMVGRVEQIDDVEDDLEAEHVARILNQTQPTNNSELSNEELLAICVAFVEQLRSGMAPWVVQRLNHTYGPMPDDISNFTFWMGLVSFRI